MARQGSEKLIRQILTATRLGINANKTNFQWSNEGCVNPGNFTRITAIGGHRPPEGKVWIEDYNSDTWEVSAADLLDATSEKPKNPQS